MTADPGTRTTYRGRFAPSPTGPLHFGSLVAAVGSYLRARSQGGDWLVRMEDVDTGRAVPDADQLILETLARFGMEWDQPVVFQSSRVHQYKAALDSLTDARKAYPCGCSRKEIDGRIYPGICRTGLPSGRSRRSMRVLTEGQSIRFTDALQGPHRQNLESEVGDFVIHRADGLFAYQLAVVVDDADQKVTEVVRGCDLLDSTPRQIYLQRLLGLTTPAYAHLPVAVDRSGSKLSKQTKALPVDSRHPVPLLHRALEFLGQHPPEELLRVSLAELWDWAVQNWDVDGVPRRHTISVEG